MKNIGVKLNDDYMNILEDLKTALEEEQRDMGFILENENMTYSDVIKTALIYTARKYDVNLNSRHDD